MGGTRRPCLIVIVWGENKWTGLRIPGEPYALISWGLVHSYFPKGSTVVMPRRARIIRSERHQGVCDPSIWVWRQRCLFRVQRMSCKLWCHWIHMRSVGVGAISPPWGFCCRRTLHLRIPGPRQVNSSIWDHYFSPYPDAWEPGRIILEMWSTACQVAISTLKPLVEFNILKDWT